MQFCQNVIVVRSQKASFNLGMLLGCFVCPPNPAMLVFTTGNIYRRWKPIIGYIQCNVCMYVSGCILLNPIPCHQQSVVSDVDPSTRNPPPILLQIFPAPHAAHIFSLFPFTYLHECLLNNPSLS